MELSCVSFFGGFIGAAVLYFAFGVPVDVKNGEVTSDRGPVVWPR